MNPRLCVCVCCGRREVGTEWCCVWGVGVGVGVVRVCRLFL